MNPVPLPVVNEISCQGCGGCCQTIGTPPGFAAFYPKDGNGIPPWAVQSPDHAYWLSAPESVRAELAAYYQSVDAGEVEDRSGYECECLWYDTEKKQCKHYEHRPEVCRDFVVGSVWCLRFRADVGLGPYPTQEEINRARAAGG